MISFFRMKIDLIGQLILIVSILLLAWMESGIGWTHTLLIVLALWQVVSALHLIIVYQYARKINFIKAMLVLICSLPLWMQLVGDLAYIPVGGVLIWYFGQTIWDARLISRRPRSFWDL